jgi:transcriptional regulator with XRE-family HTH domain
MALRNLRAVIKEKNLSLEQVAFQTGIQVSTLELIMLGVFVPGLDYRIRICRAIGEDFDNEIFESGTVQHPPLG